MSRNQLSDRARKRAGLLLDVNHPQSPPPVRLLLQPRGEPPVDNFQTPHRIARGRIPAVKPVEYVKFVGRPPPECAVRITRSTANGCDAFVAQAKHCNP